MFSCWYYCGFGVVICCTKFVVFARIGGFSLFVLVTDLLEFVPLGAWLGSLLWFLLLGCGWFLRGS